MARVEINPHLSDVQKSVMAKVAAAPTPHVAWTALSSVESDIDSNVATAKQMLADMGLLVLGDGTVEITPQGEDVMVDEFLIDPDTGELTDIGKQHADKYDDNASPQGGLPENAMSSLSLLREIDYYAGIAKTVKVKPKA